MVKNKLESLFSESMHSNTNLWGMKLISNPLTHQNTPADYIVDFFITHQDYIHQSVTVRELIVALIECKQVTCDPDGTGRLAFKRLKQMHDMINFENIRPDNHRAMFCIAFKELFWRNSEVYLVPVHQMQRLVGMTTKVSINRTEAKEALKQYKIEIATNGLLDLTRLYQGPA